MIRELFCVQDVKGCKRLSDARLTVSMLTKPALKVVRNANIPAICLSALDYV